VKKDVGKKMVKNYWLARDAIFELQHRTKLKLYLNRELKICSPIVVV
jgi:hypothetical protein